MLRLWADSGKNPTTWVGCERRCSSIDVEVMKVSTGGEVSAWRAARARATRWRSPSESRVGRWRSRWLSPTSASSSRARVGRVWGLRWARDAAATDRTPGRARSRSQETGPDGFLGGFLGVGWVRNKETSLAAGVTRAARVEAIAGATVGQLVPLNACGLVAASGLHFCPGPTRSERQTDQSLGRMVGVVIRPGCRPGSVSERTAPESSSGRRSAAG